MEGVRDIFQSKNNRYVTRNIYNTLSQDTINFVEINRQSSEER